MGELLLLAGAIELERHRPESPPLPPFLDEVYPDALRCGAALATECQLRVLDEDTRKRLVVSQHCFEGQLKEARRLFGENAPE